MQTTSAPMAWLFLQENVQVQYLQKIATQKIRLDHNISVSGWIFCALAQFSAAIEAAYFPDPQIDALQQSREGAPFMGTALAACKQSY